MPTPPATSTSQQPGQHQQQRRGSVTATRRPASGSIAKMALKSGTQKSSNSALSAAQAALVAATTPASSSPLASVNASPESSINPAPVPVPPAAVPAPTATAADSQQQEPQQQRQQEEEIQQPEKEDEKHLVPANSTTGATSKTSKTPPPAGATAGKKAPSAGKTVPASSSSTASKKVPQQKPQNQHSQQQQQAENKSSPSANSSFSSSSSSSSTAAANGTPSAAAATADTKSSVVLKRRYRGSLVGQQQQSELGGRPSASRTGGGVGMGIQRTVETASGLISRSPLFTSLRDRRVIDTIAERVVWNSVAPGNYIVLAGDVADCMYFIFSGEVEILLPVSEEEETPIATLSNGAFFGEIALVSKELTTRTASVQASKQCELLVLSRSALEDVITVSDELRECLELEANKRLATLRQKEQKLLSNETDLDRELMKKASLNPLGPVECEWRLLTKARIRGMHRTQPPPQTGQDVMNWARVHIQHSSSTFLGRTTAALATLPDDFHTGTNENSSFSSLAVAAAAAAAGGGGGGDDNNNSKNNNSSMTLLHPEMGCVFRYSAVIESLAGPDEFENLCRSFARMLRDNLHGPIRKQALGSLALAALVTLFFDHTRKRERDDFLYSHVLWYQQHQHNQPSSSSSPSSSPVSARKFSSSVNVDAIFSTSSAFFNSSIRTPNQSPQRGGGGGGNENNNNNNNNNNSYRVSSEVELLLNHHHRVAMNLEIRQQQQQQQQHSSLSLLESSYNNNSTAGGGGGRGGEIWDVNLLSEMTNGLYKAPCWEVSTNILHEQYPKSFVCSDAWAIVILERIALMREDLVRRVCCTALEQMMERSVIVKKRAADRAVMERGFNKRRLVIGKALIMLKQIESQHRVGLEKECEARSRGILRWHECCLSFVTSQKSAEESALAGQLEKGSSFDPTGKNQKLSLVAGGGRAGTTRRSTSASVSSSSAARNKKQAVALLVAQKERMADEAFLFQKRVRESRF